MGCIIMGLVIVGMGVIFTIIYSLVAKNEKNNDENDKQVVVSIVIVFILAITMIIAGVQHERTTKKLKMIIAQDKIEKISIYEQKDELISYPYYIGIKYVEKKTGNSKSELIGLDECEITKKSDKLVLVKDIWKIRVYIPKSYLD